MTTALDVFNELSATAPKEARQAYREFPCADGLHIRAFVDGPSRMPGVSFRAPKVAVPRDFALPKLRGAAVSVTGIQGIDGSSQVVYELTAQNGAFADVFVALAGRLIDDATTRPTAGDALRYMAERVATWARFFDARGDEGLPRWRQLGLIGELVCLHSLTDMLGAEEALSSWAGPLGAPHDFQFGQAAVEAKLTTSSAPERIGITSERQLDDSVVPRLMMFAVLAQEAIGGNTTLNGLVDAARSQYQTGSPSSLALFEERLLSAGYNDADRAKYAVALIVRGSEYLHVKDSFPRLRPSELRPGISSVRYDISWASAATFRISKDAVKEMIHD